MFLRGEIGEGAEGNNRRLCRAWRLLRLGADI